MELVDQSEALILFDGVCNLCDASVHFIIDNDANAYFKFASLQSAEAKPYMKKCLPEDSDEVQKDNPDYLRSVILYERGQCYKESTAVLRIARKLKGGWPLLYAFIVIPAPIRDVAYGWIARNRYKWFGRQEACRIPTPELRARFLDGLTSSSV